jgi:hypothetical protein
MRNSDKATLTFSLKEASVPSRSISQNKDLATSIHKRRFDRVTTKEAL